MKKKFLIFAILVVVSLVCEAAFAAVNVPELRKLAGKGDADAQYQLGSMYLSGKYVGVNQNYKLALDWLNKAAAQNHAGAQCEIGLIYLEGKGVKQNNKEAVKWLKKSAEQGYAQAQFKLGGLYYKGQGVVQDYSKSFSWWSKAAEQNNAGAIYNLGASYEMGWGVQQNKQEAIKYYKLAVDLGDTDAPEDLERLGVSYRKKAEASQPTKLQAKHVENWGFSSIDSMIKSAKNGDLTAQYRLGDAYFRGNGIGQDYKQAKYWYEKADEQNLVEAQYTLGMMYVQGVGVAKDYVQSEYWFRKAADNGDKNAANYLKSITPQTQAQRQAEAKQAEIAKRQEEAKEKQRVALSSRSSKAPASNSEFDSIFTDYEANPDATSRKWEGKTVYAEGILYSVDTQMIDGFTTLTLQKPGSDKYGYMFLFNNASSFLDKMNMAALASAKMSIGQKIKLKGKVFHIEKAPNVVVAVGCINAEFTQLHAWRCSKCGMIRARVIEGLGLSDLTAVSSQCELGGAHDWQRVK